MDRERLLTLLQLWQDGFRNHATVELLENGDLHHVARFAAQIALDFGTDEATIFCELIEKGNERRAS